MGTAALIAVLLLHWQPSLAKPQSHPMVSFPVRAVDKECNIEQCSKQLDQQAACCGETFNCLSVEHVDSCVFNNTVRDSEDICLQQSESCYYCCYSKRCGNRGACKTHFEDAQESALLIFVIISCLFLVAIIGISILVVLRTIRLKRVKELKLNHKFLTNHTVMSQTNSRRDSKEHGELEQEPQESFTLHSGS